MEDHEKKTVEQLLDLSDSQGDPEKAFALFGEGNTSAILESGTFVVKAIGQCLGTLRGNAVPHSGDNGSLSITGFGSGVCMTAENVEESISVPTSTTVVKC
jgi:hypothetical protein